LQNFIFGDFDADFFELLRKQSYSFQFSLVFISSAIGLKIFKINYLNLQQISKLEKEKVSTELDFLKTQINPHFLFNTLNNIYIQTRIEPKKAADMVIKLSDLLRYQLYECAEDKVMLKAEVEYLKNYVDLQELRITNIDIKFEQNGSYKGLMIHPFMLMPFLENSFKHGVSSKGVENFIHINVDIVEKYVIFAVKNSKNDTIQHNSKSDGTGLRNIRLRLDLLYSQKYELKIEDRDTFFNVELKINLE
jgi:LytS/YehU family sensor histidine kinase